MNLDQLLHVNRPYPKPQPPERFRGKLYTIYTKCKWKERCSGHEHLIGATLPLDPAEITYENEVQIEYPEYIERQQLYLKRPS